jgi:hypothetical protein
LFFVKSQYLGLIDTPKLWYLRLPFFEIWIISGFSPLESVFDLYQTAEIEAFMSVNWFTSWFTCS